MRYFLFTTIITVLIISSCNRKNEVKILNTNQMDSIQTVIVNNDNLNEQNVPELYFEIDSLRSTFEIELDAMIKDKNFQLTAEPFANTHNKTIIDTIKTFTFRDSKIYSYKSQDSEWVFSAEIRNSQLIFLDSLHVGQSESVLERILKTKLKSNVIKIGDLENTSVFVFKFQHDTLRMIKYEGYVD